MPHSGRPCSIRRLALTHGSIVAPLSFATITMLTRTFRAATRFGVRSMACHSGHGARAPVATVRQPAPAIDGTAVIGGECLLRYRACFQVIR